MVKWILLERGFGLCRGIGLHSFYHGILSIISILSGCSGLLKWSWAVIRRPWTATSSCSKEALDSEIEMWLQKWSWTVVRKPWTAKSSCSKEALDSEIERWLQRGSISRIMEIKLESRANHARISGTRKKLTNNDQSLCTYD
jgi:hypothetical protein